MISFLVGGSARTRGAVVFPLRAPLPATFYGDARRLARRPLKSSFLSGLTSRSIEFACKLDEL